MPHPLFFCPAADGLAIQHRASSSTWPEEFSLNPAGVSMFVPGQGPDDSLRTSSRPRNSLKSDLDNQRMRSCCHGFVAVYWPTGYTVAWPTLVKPMRTY